MGRAEEKGVGRGQVRLPAVLAEWLQTRAVSNYRSVNAELVDVVLCAKNHAAKAGANDALTRPVAPDGSV